MHTRQERDNTNRQENLGRIADFRRPEQRFCDSHFRWFASISGHYLLISFLGSSRNTRRDLERDYAGEPAFLSMLSKSHPI